MTIIADPVYGFLRAETIPSREEVERYYTEEFYADPRTVEARRNDAADRDYHHGRYGDMLSMMTKVEGRTILDVGCGWGEFLRYCRDHWGMTGLVGTEVCTPCVEALREEGLEVHSDDLEGPLEVAESFDVVAMLNVLEHARDPAGMLNRVREEWLADDGEVLVVVPNDYNPWQLAADEAHGLGQWWVCPPRHLNYFSHDSIRSLIEATGYEVFDQMASFPLAHFLLMGDIYIGNPLVGRACHEQRVRFETTMRRQGKAKELRDWYRSLVPLGLGRTSIVAARPRS